MTGCSCPRPFPNSMDCRENCTNRNTLNYSDFRVYTSSSLLEVQYVRIRCFKIFTFLLMSPCFLCRPWFFCYHLMGCFVLSQPLGEQGTQACLDGGRRDMQVAHSTRHFNGGSPTEYFSLALELHRSQQGNGLIGKHGSECFFHSSDMRQSYHPHHSFNGGVGFQFSSDGFCHDVIPFF